MVRDTLYIIEAKGGPMKFSVVKKPYTTKSGVYVHYQFIAIVDEHGIEHYTNFGDYVKNPKATFRNAKDDGNNRFVYVRSLLDYLFNVEGIHKLSDISVKQVQRFLNRYCQCSLPEDTAFTKRSKQSMERCLHVVMDFLENLALADIVAFKPDALYKTISVPGRRKGQMVKKKVPAFEILAQPNKATPIFRDIPNDAFDILFTHFREYHPELFGLIACQAFAGLRPSEACNVRRQNSLLYGPGIRLTMTSYDKPSHIEIDLTKERKLRSDNVSVGKIKKERTQVVPELFRQAFYDAYKEYLDYTSTAVREEDYGPLNINREGKCFTYDDYRLRFQKIVRDEVVPIYLASEDPEIVAYGRILMEKRLSPHVFRHWYTVQLVLSGMDNPAELMHARGDTSPESALQYIKDKADLEKKYRKVNDEMFDYFMWAAEKLNN